jgi:hypothetical protein
LVGRGCEPSQGLVCARRGAVDAVAVDRHRCLRARRAIRVPPFTVKIAAALEFEIRDMTPSTTGADSPIGLLACTAADETLGRAERCPHRRRMISSRDEQKREVSVLLCQMFGERPGTGCRTASGQRAAPIREAAFASLKAPLRPGRAPVVPTDASEEREASGRQKSLPYGSRRTTARPARSS